MPTPNAIVGYGGDNTSSVSRTAEVGLYKEYFALVPETMNGPIITLNPKP